MSDPGAANLQVTLKSRPQGWVRESDFALVETPLPAIAGGEVLLRTLYLSLDPYMRGRMDEVKSYAASVNLGEVMVGGTVSEVVDSRHPQFKSGDLVVSAAGWQRYSKAGGDKLMRVPAGLPPSVFLGPAGMPGVTAWTGLFDIGQPQPGETVVVSAASGAVGSVVGQLAKEKGCRVVGIAGGPEKCAYVVDTLGFDACVDYKRDGWVQQLKSATPDGVDVDFENVGGEVLDNVLKRTNAHARIALCGLIAGYNAAEPMGLHNVRALLVNRIRLQGFIVSDDLSRWPEIIRELAGRVAAGSLKYRETVAIGLENAPRAFIGLLKGENFGKQLVKVA
ncbi:MAG: NADP-dependent oxidoreductase [Betaproteobacteria bacterium]|nr:NADP-dependent oxidoreductase [Betaproteobacteria bacterium]